MINSNNRKRIINNKLKTTLLFLITFVHEHLPIYNNLKHIQIIFKLSKKCMR